MPGQVIGNAKNNIFTILQRCNRKLGNISVLAHSDDHIIKNFTSEAKKFRDEHFPADWYKTGGSTNNNEWPVVEVSVYADRLRVRYSIIRRINPSEQSATAENKCGPAKVKIFRILEARYSVGKLATTLFSQ